MTSGVRDLRQVNLAGSCKANRAYGTSLLTRRAADMAAIKFLYIIYATAYIIANSSGGKLLLSAI